MADTPNAYVICRGSDGGYFIHLRPHDPSFTPGICFAASTIDEALRYIRQKLEPGK